MGIKTLCTLGNRDTRWEITIKLLFKGNEVQFLYFIEVKAEQKSCIIMQMLSLRGRGNGQKRRSMTTLVWRNREGFAQTRLNNIVSRGRLDGKTDEIGVSRSKIN